MKKRILQNFLLLIILQSCIFGCSTVPSNEGFYRLKDARITGKKNVSVDVLNKALLTTGAFSRPKKRVISSSDYEVELLKHCISPETRKWYSKFCKGLESCKNKEQKKCAVDVFANCGGVAVSMKDKVYFVSAAHCLSAKVKDVRARFLATHSNQVIEFRLKKTKWTKHKDPYDLTLLEIIDWDKKRPTAKIGDVHRKGQNVFGVGFPNTRYRNRFSKHYFLSNGEMRVTFGQIVEPNLEGLSYCHFSNNIIVARPLSWQLEKSCQQKGLHKLRTDIGEYEARVEANVLLANTDMINGMSGSPLYDENGDVVGIGTTLLKEEFPFNYGLLNSAVYVQAENITSLVSKTNSSDTH